ncbi:MAG: hypothetical protein J6T41_02275 [Neisseriaceae bacterium]|nr:hypothetical protein [Neisseriaceae bacterium]
MKKQRHTKKFTVIASIALRQCVRNLFAMENDNAKMFSGNLKEKTVSLRAVMKSRSGNLRTQGEWHCTIPFR